MMQAKHWEFAGKVALLAAAVGLSLLGSDLLLGRLLPDAGQSRALYFSENPWVRQEYGGEFFITFPKNRTIRTYARYGNTTDYDIELQTDSNGFRNTRPFVSGRTISVVGDSFTEASGGPNWVEQLNGATKLTDTSFYNNGVGGTGFMHWAPLVEHLHGALGIARFVIVFIEDDLDRTAWFAKPVNGDIQFCGADSCARMNIYTDEVLLQQRIAKNAASNQQLSILQRVATVLPNITRAIQLARSNRSSAAARNERHQARQRTLDDFVTRLSRLKSTRLLLLHIPSKYDFYNGVEASKLSAAPANVRLGYRRCFASAGDFHVNDAHPNAQGYARLKNCVTDFINENADFIGLDPTAN